MLWHIYFITGLGAVLISGLFVVASGVLTCHSFFFRILTAEIASLLSGVLEGDEAYKDPFAGLKVDKEELEDNKLVLDDC